MAGGHPETLEQLRQTINHDEIAAHRRDVATTYHHAKRTLQQLLGLAENPNSKAINEHLNNIEAHLYPKNADEVSQLTESFSKFQTSLATLNLRADLNVADTPGQQQRQFENLVRQLESLRNKLLELAADDKQQVLNTRYAQLRLDVSEASSNYEIVTLTGVGYKPNKQQERMRIVLSHPPGSVVNDGEKIKKQTGRNQDGSERVIYIYDGSKDSPAGRRASLQQIVEQLQAEGYRSVRISTSGKESNQGMLDAAKHAARQGMGLTLAMENGVALTGENLAWQTIGELTKDKSSKLACYQALADGQEDVPANGEVEGISLQQAYINVLRPQDVADVFLGLTEDAEKENFLEQLSDDGLKKMMVCLYDQQRLLVLNKLTLERQGMLAKAHYTSESYFKSGESVLNDANLVQLVELKGIAVYKTCDKKTQKRIFPNLQPVKQAEIIKDIDQNQRWRAASSILALFNDCGEDQQKNFFPFLDHDQQVLILKNLQKKSGSDQPTQQMYELMATTSNYFSSVLPGVVDMSSMSDDDSDIGNPSYGLGNTQL